jgi:hypothetical protein
LLLLEVLLSPAKPGFTEAIPSCEL